MSRLIKIAQRECFQDDINTLLKNTTLAKQSPLISLNPFLDENKILRVGGRLVNSILPYDKIHPILLPAKHNLTTLIIREEHLKLLHGGPQLLLASLRNKYWPIDGRNNCRRIVQRCITYFKHRPTNFVPIMGNLPRSRITIDFPFVNVGLDYAGPCLIKDRKLRGSKLVKCYACLFVCLATKAIHIELAGDLTTETFLAAIRRFISRRGKPKLICSDNGTNFIGAYAEINNVIQFLKASEPRFKTELSSDNISWKFNPPSAPNFGGLWEAAVKSMKCHVRKIVGNINLTFEELYTVMVQVEGILNSRPLVSMSSDSSDYNPLTPAHFLIGRPIVSLPERNRDQGQPLETTSVNSASSPAFLVEMEQRIHHSTPISHEMEDNGYPYCHPWQSGIAKGRWHAPIPMAPRTRAAGPSWFGRSRPSRHRENPRSKHDQATGVEDLPTSHRGNYS